MVLVVRAYTPPPGRNPQVIQVNLEGRNQWMAMLGSADGFGISDRFKHRLFLLLPPVGEMNEESYVCADVRTMIAGGRVAAHLAVRRQVPMSHIEMWYRALQTAVRTNGGDVDDTIARMDDTMLEAFRLGLAGDADGLVDRIEAGAGEPERRRGRRIVVR